MNEQMTPAEKVESDRLWQLGYKAFHDCLPYSSMTTDAAREGWEQARNDTLRIGERIARQGKIR